MDEGQARQMLPKHTNLMGWLFSRVQETCGYVVHYWIYYQQQRLIRCIIKNKG